MKFENYKKAVSINNEISLWNEYLKTIENRIECNSEITIAFNETHTSIRDKKIKISRELIGWLIRLVQDEIDILNTEFENLKN